MPSRRHVTPRGWAVGMPCSAAAARNRLRNGEVPQRLCAAPSSRSRSHVPTHCSCSHAGSPAPPWSFARRHMLDKQRVGRPSHDRTTERHWQRLGSNRATVPKEVLCGSSTPAAAHATSPRAVAVRFSSVPFLGGGRPGWSGGLSLGPLPPRTLCRRHRRIAPTAQYRRMCARQLGLVRPRDPSWCPVTPSFGGPPAAGRQRVFSWVASSRVVKSHLGSPDVVCHCGTGACSRLSPPVPGPHGGMGHTCRTPPWACSVSSQSDASRK